MEYDKTNTGSLFKNDKRETDNHPTHTGSINIEGVEYWQSAWVKEFTDKNTGEKKKFFSQSFKRKEEKPKQAVQEAIGIDEDEIPF